MSNSSNIDNCSSSALPKNFNVYHHDAHSEAHEVNHSSLKSKFTGRDTGGSILLSFVRQLRPGMDLVSFSCPSFVLSPFSYLEARTDYICPLDCLLNINQDPSAESRFLRVCQWVISSMTFIPSSGVSGMKPFNPILGERFSCVFVHDAPGVSDKYRESTYAYAEQVSHHPPITCQYMVNNQHQFVYSSTSQFQVKFKGTYVETQITPEGSKGTPTLELTGLGERYYITYPNIIVTGLYWGTTQVGNDGKGGILCDKTGMELKFECNSKKHSIEGEILCYGKKIYTLKGHLDNVVNITDTRTRKSRILVNAKSIKFPKKLIRPLSCQDDMESRKVWAKVSEAIIKEDFETASREKCAIEEAQRQKRAKMDMSQYQPYWWSKQMIFDPVTGTNQPVYIFKGQQVVNISRKDYQKMKKQDSFTNYARRMSTEKLKPIQSTEFVAEHRSSFVHPK
jgi:hypothetical protein